MQSKGLNWKLVWTLYNNFSNNWHTFHCFSTVKSTKEQCLLRDVPITSEFKPQNGRSWLRFRVWFIKITYAKLLQLSRYNSWGKLETTDIRMLNMMQDCTCDVFTQTECKYEVKWNYTLVTRQTSGWRVFLKSSECGGKLETWSFHHHYSFQGNNSKRWLTKPWIITY